MFQFEFTPEALEDLKGLRKYDQKEILSAIEAQLSHQPALATRNRKKLRPNKLAEWEMRVDTFRVFYDIDQEGSVVKIEAIGQKHGNKLFVHGAEYDL